jgi:PAS domain S-box-containing protein
MSKKFEDADVFGLYGQNMKIVMDASPFGILIFDALEEIVYANPQAEKLFAKKRLEPVSFRCGDFIDCANRHDDADGCGSTSACPDCALYRAVRSVLSGAADPSFCEGEARIRRDIKPDIIWIKFKTHALEISGQPYAVMGIDDITTQKQNYIKLQHALTELAVIHEHAPIAMLLVDRDRRVKKANGYAALFAGRQADEMIGMRGGEALRCLHHLDDPEGCGFGPACAECRVRTAVLETFATKEGSHEVESWLPFPRGGEVEERCLLISTAYLNFDNTERVLVCAQDITDRKKSEILLHESRQRLESIFRAAPVGIGVVKDRIISEVNDRLCDITGRGADKLIGQNARILYATDADYEFVGQEKYNQIRKRGTGIVETRWQRPDGCIIDILLASTPMDEKDLSKGVTFTAMDISERNRDREKHRLLEAQYHQAQKLESVGRLAGGVAHDFNNLLSVILGYGEMVMEELAHDHPHHELMVEIQQAADRARHLTRQLLAFSRKQVLEMRVVDVNNVVNNLIKLLRRIIGEDIRLEFVPGPGPIAVSADTAQLEQVLMNLALNARDAMPDGGILTIETNIKELDEEYARTRPEVKPGSYAMIGVSDTGCGMDKETIELIFEPFFTTKAKDKGTGLGLATSYGIIKQHDGNIWVYSEPGKGTSFKIYLPLCLEPEERTDQADRKREPVKGSLTVMVVEDDVSVRKLACGILRRGGYTVIETDSATDAVFRAADHEGPIHLVLSDVVMPSMKGPEVWEHIRRRHPDARVLYMSGYTDDVIVRHGILAKGIAFVQKPFTANALLDKVMSLLQY